MYPSQGLEGSNIELFRHALDATLEHHEPYPALVFDADWTMAELNRGGQWLCSILLPEAMKEQRGRRHGIDMIATLAHPGGVEIGPVGGVQRHARRLVERRPGR